jgi:hypothetical protein
LPACQCTSISGDHRIHLILTMSMHQRLCSFDVCQYNGGECKGIPMAIGSLMMGYTQDAGGLQTFFKSAQNWHAVLRHQVMQCNVAFPCGYIGHMSPIGYVSMHEWK